MLERVDAAELAARFGQTLRAAEVPVAAERLSRFAHALALVPPSDRRRLYWTARVTLAGDRDHLEAFDGVFALVFDSFRDPAGGQRGDPAAGPLPAAEPGRPSSERGPDQAPDAGGDGTPMVGGASDAGDGEGERPLVLAAASVGERLADKRFDRLEPDEVAEVAALLRRLKVATPQRITRRRRSHRHGDDFDMRATVRRGMRVGEPLRLERRRRRRRPRRLVLICDVSGSMEPYARPYLLLLRSAVGAQAEVFVFATRLTRLTRALQGPDAQRALDRASAAAPDWSGGTRIGAALAEFNSRFGRRGMARGAVAVILSDGWERDDPERLGEEMARLRRLAHRVIWVNPRKASPAFAPLAGGMQAALPHCDAFLSGHSLQALMAVVDAIQGDSS